MSEPVIKAVRKARAAFKRTRAGRLESLLAEQRKWSRRETIARNKLAEVRDELVGLTINCVNIADKAEP